MSDTGWQVPHNRKGDASKAAVSRTPAESGTGIISRYHADRGFGFIARYDAPDLFFHARDFVGGDTNIEIGLKVRFELAPSQRKPGMFEAVRIQRLVKDKGGDKDMQGDDG